jgi:uncharacterized lipoprotein YajG
MERKKIKTLRQDYAVRGAFNAQPFEIHASVGNVVGKIEPQTTYRRI